MGRSIIFYVLLFCGLFSDGFKFSISIHQKKFAPLIVESQTEADLDMNLRQLKPQHNQPLVEVARYEAYAILRRNLQIFLLEKGCISRRGWIRAFERWQFTSKHAERNYSMVDPLIPSRNHSNPNLISDLSRLDNMTMDSATDIAIKLQSDSVLLSTKIFRLQKFLSSDIITKTVNEDGKFSVVELRKRPYDIVLSIKQRNTSYQCNINYNRLIILRNMWLQRYKNTFTSYNELDNINFDSEFFIKDPELEKEFVEDLYCVLMRYKSLEGPGLQGAIPPQIFQILQNSLRVSVECFASPLNFQLPQYCSAFPDTDKPFGSISSFFDFFPYEGSFQLNPPFIPSLMTSSFQHCEYLLNRTTAPMSFVLFVPAWPEDEHWMYLQQSKYLQHSVIINASDHSYRDGMDYCRRESYRPAPFNTGIVLLQNDGGKREYRWSIDIQTQIYNAYARIQPAEHLLKRQQSDGLYIPKSKRI